MSITFEAHFEGRDASAALAVASVLRCVIEHGSAAFGTLAVVYREDYLLLHKSGVADRSSRDWRWRACWTPYPAN